MIEDYTFFVNPAVADVSHDGYAETILGTGGYYLHAFDACGREPAGWPKFTGQWIIPTAAVGDLRGTGEMDVVTGTRGGYIWAWHTDGDARAGSIQWEGFRHDSANTGNWGTPLTQGVRRIAGLAPITCPLPTDDAGVTDGGPSDGAVTDGALAANDGAVTGTMDATPRVTPAGTAGGCGCRTAGGGGAQGSVGALACAALALTVCRRRRPSRVSQVSRGA